MVKRLPLLKYTEVRAVEPLSDEKFLEVLRSTYKDVASVSPIAPYVKVSALRLKTLERLGISGEEFDRRIIELNINDPHTVQLHVGSGDPNEGIKTARGVYHYAIIK
ncbi:MAG: hypothetical protein ACUVUS_04715 [Thermoproteota archaeon]